MKVLVFGISPLPFENCAKLYGTNIRTWNTVKPILDDGHDVVLVCLNIGESHGDKESSYSKPQNFVYYPLDENRFDNVGFLQKIHDNVKPDCVVGVNNISCAKALRIKTDKPVWADLNGYLPAEAQAKAYVYNDNTYLSDFLFYERATLGRADIFSAVSLPQKFALIGELALIGRLNKLTFGYEFVHVIPNSVDDVKYAHKKNVLRGVSVNQDDFIVLWSGSYNTWTDTATLFSGLEAAMRQNPQIKFVSIGGEVAGHDEKTYAKFTQRIESSRFRRNFIFKEWLPAQDVPDYYFESDVGINIDSFNYETLTGARNRLLDMFKAGLPVMTTLGTEISHLIEKEELGFVFPLHNEARLRDTILHLAKNKGILKERGERAREYVFKNLTSDKATLPLREWLKHPRCAPDRGNQLFTGYGNSCNKLQRYASYMNAEGLVSANKRVFDYLARKFKDAKRK